MRKLKFFCGIAVFAALISNYAMGQVFPDKYHTYSEGIAELQALQASYPNICQLDSIGYSTRDSVIIYQFKISDNVLTEEDEPAILFTGGVHADEILGPEIVLNFCQDLMAKYSAGDTAIQRYINTYEIYVIPFVNPEGHIVVENGDTDWRKNKSDNNHNGILDSHDGVDNNRNYDFGFSLDTTIAGNTPESLEYKGPYAFSESENRTLRDAGIKYKPIVAVEYHSPTYGRSEKVYCCWYWYGYYGGHGYSPDYNTMIDIGRGFAGSIVNDRGDSSYEARTALVDKGDFKTYYYGNFGTAAMVCEVSDTTIQDTSMVDSICQRNLVGMYWLLHRSGYARLTGVVTDSINGLPLDAIVTVQQATSSDINPRHTRPNSGRYDRLINPGTYTLTFEKTGYVTKTVTNVVVTNNAATVTNVRLRPNNLPPAAPTLLYPTDNATFADSTHLSFDWTDVSSATGYIIEIALNSNFTNIFESDSSLAISSFRNTAPFYADTFYWRVTAHNTSGFSERSAIWHYVITGTTPPLPPSLLLPGDGLISDSAFISFDWTDSPNATRYAIQVDTDSLFSPPLYSDTTLLVSAYRNPDSLANGIYYWRAKSGNLHGWSAYSQIYSFTVAVDTGIVYLLGDVNHSGEANAVDVTYFVIYLKGGPPPPLDVNGFYPEADANGSCEVNGVDVTYLVLYFKGRVDLIDGHCLR